MSKQTLRGLAKEYAKGAIGKDIYRKSRSELIKGIVAGSIAVKPIDYEAPLKPSNEIEDAITEGIERDKTEITSPQQKTRPVVSQNATAAPIKQNIKPEENKNSPFIFILVSCIIVVSLILAVVLFYPKPPAPTSSVAEASNNTSDTVNTINTESTTTTDESVSETTAETLMADFLSEKSWAEESMDNFIESWTALTPEERDSASQTNRMTRMKDSIYKQFLEGKALASIDSEKARMKQQKLIEFANAIGIDDSRLTLE